MRSPLERLSNKAIQKLPDPTPEASTKFRTLTEPQKSSLRDMYSYLHGASHGFGHDGPIRRRLQEMGLLGVRDDGWLPTHLGWQVIKVIIENENSAIQQRDEIFFLLKAIVRFVIDSDSGPLIACSNSTRHRKDFYTVFCACFVGIDRVEFHNGESLKKFLSGKKFACSSYFYQLASRVEISRQFTYAAALLMRLP